MKFVIDNWLLILICLSSGAMLAWPKLSGRASAGGVSVAAAVQLINRERGVLVDVRNADEFAAGHPVGARNVPVDDLEAKLAGTVKNKNVPLLLMCGTGVRAQRALATAKKLGYEQAQVVAGGMKSWKEANLPVVKS